MDWGDIRVSVHAFQRFDERGFKASEIETAVRKGKIIRQYLDDRPWPSYLVLGKVRDKLVHVVLARSEKDNRSMIVTAYEPGEEDWNPDLTTRRR